MNLKALRSTVAEFLGLVLCELFPNIQLIESETTNISFSYDVAAHEPIDHEMLPIIEERLRLRIKETPSMHTLNMMRENACAFLRHHNQHLKAEKLALTRASIAPILQIGENYATIAPTQLVDELPKKLFIKLLDVQSFENCSRITGTLFLEQSELKSFLKQYKDASQKSHLKYAHNLFLLLKEGIIWLPKGVLVKDNLRRLVTALYPQIEPHVQNEKEILINPPLSSFCFFEKVVLDSDSFNGLFDTSHYETDNIWTFCPLEKLKQELTSSLQFIEKIIKMFGLSHRWVLSSGTPIPAARKNWNAGINLLQEIVQEYRLECTPDDWVEARFGPTVRVLLKDAKGREWPGGYVTIDYSSSQRLMIRQSVYDSLDRFIGLLLEQGGVLPTWLTTNDRDKD